MRGYTQYELLLRMYQKAFTTIFKIKSNSDHFHSVQYLKFCLHLLCMFYIPEVRIVLNINVKLNRKVLNIVLGIRNEKLQVNC